MSNKGQGSQSPVTYSVINIQGEWDGEVFFSHSTSVYLRARKRGGGPRVVVSMSVDGYSFAAAEASLSYCLGSSIKERRSTDSHLLLFTDFQSVEELVIFLKRHNLLGGQEMIRAEEKKEKKRKKPPQP